jgi:hypothetical protein
MEKRERYKVFITDPLLSRMVEETNAKFPEEAARMDFVLAETGDEQELMEKAKDADILVGARYRLNEKII